MTGFPWFIAAVCFCVTISGSSVGSSAGSSNGSTIVIDEDNDPYLHTRRLWTDADKGLKKAMSKMVKSVMPTMMREIYSRNVSSSCLGSLLQLTNELKRGKLWAFKMVDACGKLPEGFLTGSLSILGDYKECLGIQVNSSKIKTQGQYCLVDVMPPTPKWRPFMSVHVQVPELENISDPDTVISHIAGFVHNLHITTLKLGLCFPSQCTPTDAQNIIDIIPGTTGINWEFKIKRCDVRKELEFTQVQWRILYVFGVILSLVGLASILDIFIEAEKVPLNGIKGNVYHMLHAFSVSSNGRKLSRYCYEDEKLRFVNGALYMSLFWVVIANTFMYVNFDVTSNILEGMYLTLKLIYQVLLNRIVPMQTFFFFCGFISAYQVMKNPEKPFSVWKYILRRYLRYTPTYAFFIMLVMLTPTWGSGPTWDDKVTTVYQKCMSKWWTNILYVNNFIPIESSCMDHTWMLAIDAQLHIIGIFVLVPLKRKPTIGLTVNFVLMVAGLLTVALTNVYYEIPPNEMMVFMGPKDTSFYAQLTYTRVYTHLCIYCMGIATGYLMATRPKLKLTRCMTWLTGIVAVTAALAALTSINEWARGVLPPPMIGATYAALGKLAWAVFLSWITIVCMGGSGGVLKDYLSWRPFSFFSRLAFLVYLLHPVIINVAMAFQKSHLYIEDFQILYIIVSHLGGSCLVAYICHLAFEAPFLSLVDFFKKKGRSKSFDSTVNLPVINSHGFHEALNEKPTRYNSTQPEALTRTKF